MKTNLRRLLLLSTFLCAAALSGCAAVPLPPEAKKVKLFSAPAAKVILRPPGLALIDGTLSLVGSVERNLVAKSTSGTHLDVFFYDTAGNELRLETAEFYPRDLRPKTRGTPTVARYRMPILNLPADTDRIEVRAHDGEHPRPPQPFAPPSD